MIKLKELLLEKPTKNDIDNIKKKLDKSIRKKISKTNIKYKPTSYQIDWGGRKKGQGKRIGGMVTGAMSDAPTGVKSYPNIFGNVPDVDKIKNDLDILSKFEGIRYLKARSYGLNHDESMYYALTAKDD